jgi:hypothetical protein
MTSDRGINLVDPATTFADVRAAEKEACLLRNGLAAKTVAVYSRDVVECTELLAMLGLDLSELKWPAK